MMGLGIGSASIVKEVLDILSWQTVVLMRRKKGKSVSVSYTLSRPVNFLRQYTLLA